jgi:hypothetical protein
MKGKKLGLVELNAEEKVAFRQLLEAFKKALVLRHFDPTLLIRIETNVSIFAMVGILS